MGQQIVTLVDREIALVFFHHGDKHFAGQFQVAGVKFTAQRGGGFNQVGNLGQQGRIGMNFAAGFEGNRVDLLFDRSLAGLRDRE